MKKLILLSFVLYTLYLFAGDNVVGDYVTARKSVNATDSLVARMQVLKKINYFPSIYTTRPGTIINYKDSGLYRFTGISWLPIGKTYYADHGVIMNGDTVELGGISRINNVDMTLNTAEDWFAIHSDEGNDLLLLGKNTETNNLLANLGVGGKGFFKVEDSIYVEVQRNGHPILPVLNYVFDTAGLRLDRNVDTSTFTENHLVPKKWVLNRINRGSRIYSAGSGIRLDGDTIKLGDKNLYDLYHCIVLPFDTAMILGDTTFLGAKIAIQNKPLISRAITFDVPSENGETSGIIGLFPEVLTFGIRNNQTVVDTVAWYFGGNASSKKAAIYKNGKVIGDTAEFNYYSGVDTLIHDSITANSQGFAKVYNTRVAGQFYNSVSNPNNTNIRKYDGNLWVSSLYTTYYINSEATQTVQAGSAGNYTYSMPFQGSSYKKFIIYFNGFSIASPTGVNFPVAFSNTPYMHGAASCLAVCSVNSTALTIGTATTITGYVIIEGY